MCCGGSGTGEGAGLGEQRLQLAWLWRVKKSIFSSIMFSGFASRSRISPPGLISRWHFLGSKMSVWHKNRAFFFLFLMKSGDVVLSSCLFVSFGVSSFRDTYRDEFAVPRGAPGGAAPVRGEIPLPGALATSTPHSPGREGLRGSCPHPLCDSLGSGSFRLPR